MHLPSPAQHQLSPHYLLWPVIAALDQYIRQYLLQQLQRGVLLKQYHRIHRGQRSQLKQTTLLRPNGPLRALQPLYRSIAVQPDHQPVSQPPGLRQVHQVTVVQQVKTTVGKNHPLPGTLPVPHLRPQSLPRGPNLRCYGLHHPLKDKYSPSIQFFCYLCERTLVRMSRFHTLTIKHIHRETPDSVAIDFDVPESLHPAFQFKAGQYLTLRADVDGADLRRSYSLCSAPSEQAWRVGIKQVPGGRFSTYANQVLRPGDTLEVMPPEGRFSLPDAPGDHVVAFASGSGITPILSITQDLLFQHPETRVTLFYGNKKNETIMFRDTLEHLKNKFPHRLSVHHILSQEVLGLPLYQGRIDKEKCAAFVNRFFDKTSVSHYLLCGPEAMILDLKEELLHQGASEASIHFELFASPGQSTPAPTAVTAESTDAAEATGSSFVTIRLDGNDYNFDLEYQGLNFIDAAEARGIDVPYSCKGGVCCTCKALVMDGEVKMEKNYSLEPDELEEGFILTCQSHPRSPRVVLNFDV